jgi:transcriptional regulator with XRE-family HTH domain
METMGQRVRRLRERQGWTVQNLASLIGAVPSTVRRIEKGATPTFPHGLGLAEAFGVPPEYIVWGKVTPPAERIAERERLRG